LPQMERLLSQMKMLLVDQLNLVSIWTPFVMHIEDVYLYILSFSKWYCSFPFIHCFLVDANRFYQLILL
jgi:hypothetical protein